MDSLTQMTLGAAVGVAVGGRKYGKKSALIGAICGTIPDLDTFLFAGTDPVTQFTYHRGFSHSLIFCLLATPLFAWVFTKIKWFGVAFKDFRLHLLIFLAFLTHVILDGLTIYGTQIFWGFGVPPTAAGSVFIIDPLYTVPLLIALIIYFFNKSIRVVNVALIISTLYLGWGLAAQHHVKTVFQQNTSSSKQNFLVQTTPFNTFLWRILVMKENSYEVGYYSIFDDSKEIDFKSYESTPSLLKPIKNEFTVQRLEWFTKGFYSVTEQANNIIITDLRMGLEPNNYVFGFIVAKREEGQIITVPNQRHSNPRDMSKLNLIWQRIWDEEIKL